MQSAYAEEILPSDYCYNYYYNTNIITTTTIS